ncbi:hypothetical protein HDU82_002671 [Entophlyctis luteolus]|nr:hypothetical protein HDU82_002671 [Entophlyctis luteolus]
MNKSSTVVIRKTPLTSDVATSLISKLNQSLFDANPDPSSHSWSLNTEEVADGLGTFMVAYDVNFDGIEVPVGCGAIRKITLDQNDCETLGVPLSKQALLSNELTSFAGELKRMYVEPRYRGKGVGRSLVEALTAAAQTECGVSLVVLETGPYLSDAIRLYTRCGFAPTGLFGEYRAKGLSKSLCMMMTVGRNPLETNVEHLQNAGWKAKSSIGVSAAKRKTRHMLIKLFTKSMKHE